MHKQQGDSSDSINVGEKEIEVHKQLAGYPFIVNLFSYGEEGGSYYILMELGLGGNLTTYIHRHNINNSFITIYAAEILLAVNHIHSKGFIYHDLKSDNIVFGADGHIRLCDFGLACKLTDEPTIQNKSGTNLFLSPEIITSTPCDGKSVDYWSYGCLLYELYTSIFLLYYRNCTF